MKTSQRLFLLCAATAFAFSAAAVQVKAQTFSEERHYSVVSNPVAVQVPEGKVEVREFFWYGCPHCYTLEPHIKNWKKPAAVEFVTTPAILGEKWVDHAHAYYALKALGRLEELHSVLFDALHAKRKRVYSLDEIAAFFSEYDIDPDKFKETARSFLVETQIKRAERLGKAYGINGVPSFVINGKYVTSPRMAGSYEVFFKIVDYLVAKESPGRLDAAPPKDAARSN